MKVNTENNCDFFDMLDTSRVAISRYKRPIAEIQKISSLLKEKAESSSLDIENAEEFYKYISKVAVLLSERGIKAEYLYQDESFAENLLSKFYAEYQELLEIGVPKKVIMEVGHRHSPQDFRSIYLQAEELFSQHSIEENIGKSAANLVFLSVYSSIEEARNKYVDALRDAESFFGGSHSTNGLVRQVAFDVFIKAKKSVKDAFIQYDLLRKEWRKDLSDLFPGEKEPPEILVDRAGKSEFKRKGSKVTIKTKIGSEVKGINEYLSSLDTPQIDPMDKIATFHNLKQHLLAISKHFSSKIELSKMTQLISVAAANEIDRGSKSASRILVAAYMTGYYTARKENHSQRLFTSRKIEMQFEENDSDLILPAVLLKYASKEDLLDIKYKKSLGVEESEELYTQEYLDIVRKSIIEIHLDMAIGYAISLASKYEPLRTLSIQDIKQHAMLGLVEGVDTYDASFDASFDGWIYQCVRREIVDYIRANARESGTFRTWYKFSKLINFVCDELGILDLSYENLALIEERLLTKFSENLPVSKDTVTKLNIRDVVTFKPEKLRLHRDFDSMDLDENIEEGLIREDAKSRGMRIIEGLSEQERLVVILLLEEFRNQDGDKPVYMTKIGKSLNLTGSRISQIFKKIKLKSRDEAEKLYGDFFDF